MSKSNNEVLIQKVAPEILQGLEFDPAIIPSLIQAIVPVINTLGCRNQIARVEIAKAAVQVAPQFKEVCNRFCNSLDAALAIIKEERLKTDAQYTTVINAVLAKEDCSLDVQQAYCKELLAQRHQENIESIRVFGDTIGNNVSKVIVSVGTVVIAVPKAFDMIGKVTTEKQKTKRAKYRQIVKKDRTKEWANVLKDLLGDAKKTTHKGPINKRY